MHYPLKMKISSAQDLLGNELRDEVMELLDRSLEPCACGCFGTGIGMEMGGVG